LINSKRAKQFLEKLNKISVEYMKTDDDIPESVKRSRDFTVSINAFTGGVVSQFDSVGNGLLAQRNCAPVSKIIKDTSDSLFAF
jgi:hypothetical protein